jgi:hypothetical protein
MAMRASLLASLPVPQGVGQEEQVPDAVSEERYGYQIAYQHVVLLPFLLRSFGRPRGLRHLCPLLDPAEHPSLHDEVLPLYEQVVEENIPHTRLEPASLPKEQARGSLVDLFQDEGPSTSFLDL